MQNLSPLASHTLDVSTLSSTELSSVIAAQNATLAAQGKMLATQDERIAALTHQLDWFRRQLFGQKRVSSRS